MERNSGLNPNVMYRLGGLISVNHRWADIFKQAHEVFKTSNTDKCPCSSWSTTTKTADGTISQHPMRLPLLFLGMKLGQLVTVTLCFGGEMGHSSESTRGLRCMSVYSTHSFSFMEKTVTTMISPSPPIAPSDSLKSNTPHTGSNNANMNFPFSIVAPVCSSSIWLTCGQLPTKTA